MKVGDKVKLIGDHGYVDIDESRVYEIKNRGVNDGFSVDVFGVRGDLTELIFMESELELYSEKKEISDSDFKVGDKVFHVDTDEGLYFFGTLTKIYNEKEADLDFTHGGSVSPVYLPYCEKVSDQLFEYGKSLELVCHGVSELASGMGMEYREN